MQRLVAVRPTDIKEIEYKDTGVIFKIRPLPLRIKVDIKNSIYVLTVGGKNEAVDMTGLTIKAVKYGIAGWENLLFADGTKCEPKFEQCSQYGVQCLTDESVEVLHNIADSAFNDISSLCNNFYQIDSFISENVKPKVKKKKAKLKGVKKK